MRERERLIARLTAAAEALARDTSARAESLDVAADFLPADGEALALAEEAASRERCGQPAPPAVVALTNQERPGTRALRVPIRSRDRLLCNSFAMADQPRSLDRSRLGDAPLTTLSQEELAELERALLGILGIGRLRRQPLPRGQIHAGGGGAVPALLPRSRSRPVGLSRVSAAVVADGAAERDSVRHRRRPIAAPEWQAGSLRCRSCEIIEATPLEGLVRSVDSHRYWEHKLSSTPRAICRSTYQS